MPPGYPQPNPLQGPAPTFRNSVKGGFQTRLKLFGLHVGNVSLDFDSVNLVIYQVLEVQYPANLIDGAVGGLGRG